MLIFFESVGKTFNLETLGKMVAVMFFKKSQFSMQNYFEIDYVYEN